MIQKLFQACSLARSMGHDVKLSLLDEGYTVHIKGRNEKTFKILPGDEGKEVFKQAMEYLQGLVEGVK